MHYYKRDIGDYYTKAGRLSMLEHGAYTLLMDACYDRERFPTEEQAVEWTWARTEEEVQAVKFVLGKFFTLHENGTYVQTRTYEEIEAYKINEVKNRLIALAREARKQQKTEFAEACDQLRQRIVTEPGVIEHEACTDRHEAWSELVNNLVKEHELSPNYKSRTINQELSNNSSSEKDPDEMPRKKSSYTDADMETAEWMYNCILLLNPNHKKPNLKSWADDVRLMRERDKRTIHEIRQVFGWSNKDSFWRRNILSPGKLRDKFDDLVIKMPRGAPVDFGGFAEKDYTVGATDGGISEL